MVPDVSKERSVFIFKGLRGEGPFLLGPSTFANDGDLLPYVGFTSHKTRVFNKTAVITSTNTFLFKFPYDFATSPFTLRVLSASFCNARQTGYSMRSSPFLFSAVPDRASKWEKNAPCRPLLAAYTYVYHSTLCI